MPHRYPKEFGHVVKDLSPDEPGHENKALYAIWAEDNPRDFSALPKCYGVFWSSVGPRPVNDVAVGLWPRFGNPNTRDDEENVDGKDTKEGECYSGSAYLSYGSSYLSLSVEKVNVDHSKDFLILHRKGLIEKALGLQGIPLDGRLSSAIEELGQWPWMRAEGAVDPLYDIFGHPRDEGRKETGNTSENDHLGEMSDFLQRILSWRPEKKSPAGKQHVVLKVVYPKTRSDDSDGASEIAGYVRVISHTPKNFYNKMHFTVLGPQWENESDKDGFCTEEEAAAYIKKNIWPSCKHFRNYANSCPALVALIGLGKPADTRWMKSHDNDSECRMEIVTKEKFTCILHNHMVKLGQLKALAYGPPHAPQYGWYTDMSHPFVNNGTTLYLEAPLPSSIADEYRKSAQFVVLDLLYPRGYSDNRKKTRSNEEFANKILMASYGPTGDDWMDKDCDEAFLSKDDAIAYAKKTVIREENEDWFIEYDIHCPKAAASDGPWDSAELSDESKPDSPHDVWVGVLTRNHYNAFIHNLFVARGKSDGELYIGEYLPSELWKFMGWRQDS